jgi:hypothetical protein
MAFSSEQEGIPTMPQPLWHGATVFVVSSEGFILTDKTMQQYQCNNVWPREDPG